MTKEKFRLVSFLGSLHDLADATALAAAAELVGAQDALTRADTVARTNTPTRWYDGAVGTMILSGTTV